MGHANILCPPDEDRIAAWPPALGKRFLVTVDTEEEFDWEAPMRREGYGLASVDKIAQFQSFCEIRGVAPLYFIDYPVASSPEAIAILGPAVEAGRAEIGLHLHPWVNPPFCEELTGRNSFPGNLDAAQERAKFAELRALIEGNFGHTPVIYRAGRYGAGRNTAQMLAEEGIALDSSVRAGFNYSDLSGPDYSRHPLRPFWLDTDRSLLELPVTTAHTGLMRKHASWLEPLRRRHGLLSGLLARLKLFERVPLTPEGITAQEAVRALDVCIADSLPLLVLTCHSPSFAPGNTPYVQSQSDLDGFYLWWETAFDYLHGRGLGAIKASEIVTALGLA